jgi:hypothetical protein
MCFSVMARQKALMPESLVEMVFLTPLKAAARALRHAMAATPASSKVMVAMAGTVARVATQAGIPESQVTGAMLVKRAPTPNVAVARAVAQVATASAAQVATALTGTAVVTAVMADYCAALVATVAMVEIAAPVTEAATAAMAV